MVYQAYTQRVMKHIISVLCSGFVLSTRYILSRRDKGEREKNAITQCMCVCPFRFGQLVIWQSLVLNAQALSQ